MSDENSAKTLIFFSKKLITILKIAGAIPAALGVKNLVLKAACNFYLLLVSICCVYTIIETIIFVLINIENIDTLISGLWIKASLFITTLQLIGFFNKRGELLELMKSCPEVVTKNIEAVLKIYMKRAKRLFYLLIWTYIFISVAASISLEYRTQIFGGDEKKTKNTENDFFVSLLKDNSHDLILEAIKYIHYGSFFIFGLFQLVSVMLYIQICCFIQGYADHLADSVSILTISSDQSSENRNWASYSDPEVCDIRYLATMHQFTIKLTRKTNSIFSLQMQMKMWRIIMVLCLTAKEITDHAEISRLSLVLAVEFATNMWELFIFGSLADNLDESRHRFRQNLTYTLASQDNIHTADYTSLKIIMIGSNIKYSLTAGPFYRLSHKTFNAVIALSYSYYSFLKKVKA